MAAHSASTRKPTITVCCVDETGATTCYHYNWEESGIPPEITERPHSGARSGKKADRTGFERPIRHHRPGITYAGAYTHSGRSGRADGADRGARSGADPDGKSIAYERSGRAAGSIHA